MYKEHVVGIKNMSALLRGQIIKRHRKRYICEKCNDSFEKSLMIMLLYVYMRNKI